jgi:4-diphosphocytidyl-2-C-methyl-D-erythritol kinase
MHDTLARDWSGILGEMPIKTIQRMAPAKVNLSLSVGMQNTQGMHQVASKAVCVDFSDDIEVTRLEEDGLSRYAILWHEDAKRKSPIDWSVTNDLAVRAHRMLEAVAGKPLPVQMKLQKRIPIGGGLGGGSSDAAAMLLATSELFDLNYDLVAIGANLGSDIPFLLTGGSAIVTGLGESIESHDVDELHLVLIMPEYGCPTGEVFDAYDELDGGDIDESRVRNGEVFNDLLEAACSVASELEDDMKHLTELLGCEIHLSGSGSTMFCICNNALEADEIAKMIESQTELVAIATHTCMNKEELENTT